MKTRAAAAKAATSDLTTPNSTTRTQTHCTMSSDAAPAAAAAPKAATSAKKAASKPSGPTSRDMVLEAVAALKERKGSSVVAIKKSIGAKHTGLAAGWEKRVNAAVKLLVAKGSLAQHKGHFKLSAAAKKPPAKPKAAKPKAAKAPSKAAGSSKSKSTQAPKATLGGATKSSSKAPKPAKKAPASKKAPKAAPKKTACACLVCGCLPPPPPPPLSPRPASSTPKRCFSTPPLLQWDENAAEHCAGVWVCGGGWAVRAAGMWPSSSCASSVFMCCCGVTHTQ
jgi:hypothetical protein